MSAQLQSTNECLRLQVYIFKEKKANNAISAEELKKIIMNYTYLSIHQLNQESVSKNKLTNTLRATKHRHSSTESKIQEVIGNVFDAPQEYSLVHCVSKDLKMNQGIAWQFKRIFKNLPVLRAQRQGPGSVALLKDNDRYVFYLVTKIRHFHKPTYESLFFSLVRLKQFCDCLNVTKLAMPKIGCGLDHLNWVRVKNLMGQVFRNTDVEIVVYSLPKHWVR